MFVVNISCTFRFSKLEMTLVFCWFCSLCLCFVNIIFIVRVVWLRLVLVRVVG